MNAISNLTSNEYYGGLNRRFERRAARLRRLGFKYEATEHGAVFARRSRLNVHRITSIPAPVLNHADNRAWVDALRNAGVRTGSPLPLWRPGG